MKAPLLLLCCGGAALSIVVRTVLYTSVNNEAAIVELRDEAVMIEDRVATLEEAEAVTLANRVATLEANYQACCGTSSRSLGAEQDLEYLVRLRREMKALEERIKRLEER